MIPIELPEPLENEFSFLEVRTPRHLWKSRGGSGLLFLLLGLPIRLMRGMGMGRFGGRRGAYYLGARMLGAGLGSRGGFGGGGFGGFGGGGGGFSGGGASGGW